MEKFLRNTLIGAVGFFGAFTLAQCAKASDFTVTTQQNYDGGWTSTYRSLPAGNPETGGIFVLKDFKPLPNACDLQGKTGFELVTRFPGERQCVGGR